MRHHRGRRRSGPRAAGLRVCVASLFLLYRIGSRWDPQRSDIARTAAVISWKKSLVLREARRVRQPFVIEARELHAIEVQVRLKWIEARPVFPGVGLGFHPGCFEQAAECLA